MPLSLTAAADDNGRRLDRILRKALRGLPLSAIHRLLRQGCIRVDGETAAAAMRVQTGQTITVSDLSQKEFTRGRTDAGNASFFAYGQREKLAILFEGSGLLVLDKPSGIAVHGAHSLGEQALSYLSPKIPPSLSFKPGPLHRLDKPSSGVIAFSTSLEGARVFSAMMRERSIKKFYLALVEGTIEKAEIWRDELSRDKTLKKTFAGDKSRRQTKAAITRVKPLARNAACTLILAEIETGRSHQIRAQAAARGHPLLGDKKYGAGRLPTSGAVGFLLHAWRMEFPVLIPGVPGFIQAPIPDYFRTKIRELFGKDIPLEKGYDAL
ncbi:MAG: RluA family pseudouridine synthase [Treponema sp.]|nr:RluA family pseudouridine synthase [Treponema sp.]